MEKEKLAVIKLYQIASLGFYLVALCFLGASVIKRDLTYSPVGVAFLCFGILFFALSKRKRVINDDHGEIGNGTEKD